MIRRTVITWLLASAGLSAAPPDLLRFTNGDQLHGAFLGIKDGPQALWQRDDVGAPVEFKTTGIRHVVLHGGRPIKSLGSLSHVVLVGGDRVPGTIIGINDEHVTLETSYAGVLKIPRNQISMLAPNPLGGRVHYYGPFAEDGWHMTHPSFPDGLPDAPAEDEKKKEDEPGRWKFSGSAWYWQDKPSGTALIHEKGMPDRAVLRFSLAWKNRLSISIGFHSDFKQPKPKDEDVKKPNNKAQAFMPGDTSELPRLFGNSYVLQVYSSYLMLFRTTVDEEGKGNLERVQVNSNNLRLGESGRADVEVRSNRLTGAISLFVNDEFVAQWSESVKAEGDGEGFAGKGDGFGFVVQGDETPVRISDVVVSEWNGMPDSARSMQVEDQDVVLMSNGTDRFAGKVGALEEDGVIGFAGKHGSFRFPISEVAEIRFAHERLAAVPEIPTDNIVVRLSPIGAVSGKPVSGDGTTLGIENPILGAMTLSLEPAVMLEFNSSNTIIDDWDADF